MGADLYDGGVGMTSALGRCTYCESPAVLTAAVGCGDVQKPLDRCEKHARMCDVCRYEPEPDCPTVGTRVATLEAKLTVSETNLATEREMLDKSVNAYADARVAALTLADDAIRALKALNNAVPAGPLSVDGTIAVLSRRRGELGP